MRCSIQFGSWKANAWRLTILLGAVVWAAASESAQAKNLMKVEEAWELVVNSTADADNSPQVTCVISPSTVDVRYMALDINYHSQKSYLNGGVQIHVWDPATPSDPVNSPSAGSKMLNGAQTITWTTQMAVQQPTVDPITKTYNADGTLTYKIKNANSATWNDFSKDSLGNSALQITETNVLNFDGGPLLNLNNYDPTVSVNNSGVEYAGYRVTSLKLLSVTYYFDDNSTSTDSSGWTVFVPTGAK